MSSSFRSTTLSRLFAGVSAAAALAIAAPVFADTTPSATTTTAPVTQPAVPAMGKTVDKTTDSKAVDTKSGAATTDMKGSTDAKSAPDMKATGDVKGDTKAAPAKSSAADQAVTKEKTKVASTETGAVKHHHKAKTAAKPSTEKTDSTTGTDAAGK